MKKVILILILFSLSIIFCNAQTYFNNEYAKAPWTNDWGRSIVKHDSIYNIISGYEMSGVADVGLLKINDKGIVINETEVGNLTYHIGLFTGWSNNIVLLSDGSVIGSGTRDDSISQYPFIVKFKPNGDTAWYHYFTNLGINTTGQQIRGTADGGFLIAGEQFAFYTFNSPSKIIIIKTDSMGNYLWHQTYDNPAGYQNRLASFMKKDDNTFMFGHIYQNLSGGWAAGQVVGIDSMGNVKWRHQYNKPKDVGGTMACPSNYINGYYFSGYYDTLLFPWQNTNNFFVQYIARADTSGNIVWLDFSQSTSEEKSFWYMKEINGYVYVIGDVLDSSRNFLPSGFFCKYDSLGNLKWMQRYHAYLQTADSYLSDFVPTDDGGFMLCGSGFDSTHHQSVWVVRVDSNGCEVANCLVDTNVGIAHSPAAISNELQLYPNPATNLLMIQSANLLIENIEVYNILGELQNIKIENQNPEPSGQKSTTQQIQLDVSGLASGIYLVKVTDKQGKIKTAKFVKE